MPDFYTLVIRLINQSEEIGEKQLWPTFSLWPQRGPNSALMQVAQSLIFFNFFSAKLYPKCHICDTRVPVYGISLCISLFVLNVECNDKMQNS